MFEKLRPICAVSMILITFPRSAAAQIDAGSDLLARISAFRVQNGLAPLALNDQLAAAAQRHSQDMANTGSVSHIGSGGSTAEQRITAAGYTPFVAWGENIYGGGIATVNDAWEFWTTSPVHRGNLLSERYREIGIGVAASANGTYYTLNFGARSGVLPFFVDQGSPLSDPNVTLRLSNEDAVPSQRAIEVRVGEGEDLSGVAWQPWRQSIPFTMSSVVGPHRITVEYRDASGTVAAYFRIVTLSGVPLQATFTPTVEPTPTPSDTSTPPPTDTPAPTPTDTPAPAPTDTPQPTPTSTAQPTATSVALATMSPVAIIPSAVVPSSTPSASLTLAPPFDSGRSPLEALVARGWSDAPPDAIGLVAGLQLLAIVIGAALVARRIHRS